MYRRRFASINVTSKIALLALVAISALPMHGVFASRLDISSNHGSVVISQPAAQVSAEAPQEAIIDKPHVQPTQTTGNTARSTDAANSPVQDTQPSGVPSSHGPTSDSNPLPGHQDQNVNPSPDLIESAPPVERTPDDSGQLSESDSDAVSSIPPAEPDQVADKEPQDSWTPCKAIEVSGTSTENPNHLKWGCSDILILLVLSEKHGDGLTKPEIHISNLKPATDSRRIQARFSGRTQDIKVAFTIDTIRDSDEVTIDQLEVVRGKLSKVELAGSTWAIAER